MRPVHGWDPFHRVRRLLSGLLLSLVAASAGAEEPRLSPGPGEKIAVVPGPLPDALVGRWSVTGAAGEQPVLLKVPDAKALVGRDAEIGPTSFRRWNVLSARVVAASRYEGSLQAYVGRIGLSKPPPSLGEGDFVFYLLQLADCSSHGKPLDGCPTIFTVAQNRATGGLGLVLVPATFVTLGPAAPERGRNPSDAGKPAR